MRNIAHMNSLCPPLQNNPDPHDADSCAVEAVIVAETEAFRMRNEAAWAACWLQSERTEYVCVMPNAGLINMRGWDAVRLHISQVMHDGDVCPQIRYDRHNMHIQVGGDMAWARFDGVSWFTDGCSLDTYETRMLERVDGVWRIAHATVVPKHGNDLGQGVMSLNSKGQVIWSSPGVLDRLKTHPIFMLSQGRLRARRPEWDKNLQSALTHAATYHSDFQLHKYTSMNGNALRYPIFLGETDEGGLAMAHVLVRDQLTYLQIDGEALIERHLHLARSVYGLSDGQLALARLIVRGDGLKVAAGKLGISVNTARTHLTRLYEKTGVHAQTALVRLLLSTG